MFKKSILIILILSALNSCDNQSESPNIIMMIGDGMGISQVSTSMYSMIIILHLKDPNI